MQKKMKEIPFRKSRETYWNIFRTLEKIKRNILLEKGEKN